eukprot:5292239-Amphidinium_carterae.1
MRIDMCQVASSPSFVHVCVCAFGSLEPKREDYCGMSPIGAEQFRVPALLDRTGGDRPGRMGRKKQSADMRCAETGDGSGFLGDEEAWCWDQHFCSFHSSCLHPKML